MKYKHLFFDLDHTLWDFERNSAEALAEIVVEFKLLQQGVPSLEEFKEKYYVINDEMWELYRKNKISQQELRDGRFYNTLLKFNINNQILSNKIGNYYIKTSPFKTYLFPNCLEVLNELKTKYELHIITNGFVEVQYIKLDNSKLTPFFSQIITSEKAGVKKPDPLIFEVALREANAKKEESLMIGDNIEADVKGAKDFGINQVFFNPKSEPIAFSPTHEINNLKELLTFL